VRRVRGNTRVLAPGRAVSSRDITHGPHGSPCPSPSPRAFPLSKKSSRRTSRPVPPSNTWPSRLNDSRGLPRSGIAHSGPRPLYQGSSVPRPGLRRCRIAADTQARRRLAAQLVHHPCRRGGPPRRADRMTERRTTANRRFNVHSRNSSSPSILVDFDATRRRKNASLILYTALTSRWVLCQHGRWAHLPLPPEKKFPAGVAVRRYAKSIIGRHALAEKSRPPTARAPRLGGPTPPRQPRRPRSFRHRRFTPGSVARGRRPLRESKTGLECGTALRKVVSRPGIDSSACDDQKPHREESRAPNRPASCAAGCPPPS